MAMEEDDIKEIGEDEKEKLNDVDYLTGVPLPNDILLNAVPVCTHYVVAQSYKYRVKIIHGIVKKGKSCKNGDEFVWSHSGSKPMRERVDGGMHRTGVDGCDYGKRQDICGRTDRKVMCFGITYGFCLVRYHIWVLPRECIEEELIELGKLFVKVMNIREARIEREGHDEREREREIRILAWSRLVITFGRLIGLLRYKSPDMEQKRVEANKYFLYQLLCVLKYIHSANVLHRNLKPSN
ncbi:putative NFACT protein [Helianthus annuus]|nr:putative NFACT protein [Helianthus annuus]